MSSHGFNTHYEQHLAEAARERSRLETAVFHRYGYIRMIKNISDDGLRQMLEDKPSSHETPENASKTTA